MASSVVKSLAFLSVMALATVSQAVVLDDFEDPWVSNYTATHGSATALLAVPQGTGWTGASLTNGGANLGKNAGTYPGNITYGYLWNGPEQVSIGDTASIWVNVPSGAFNGGGLVLKTIPGGAYVVGVGDNAGSARLWVGTHDLLGGGGSPLLFGPTQFGAHTARFTTTLGVNSTWYKLVATITAPDEFTVQVDVSSTRAPPAARCS
jgi:hypothetical protein